MMLVRVKTQSRGQMVLPTPGRARRRSHIRIRAEERPRVRLVDRVTPSAVHTVAGRLERLGLPRLLRLGVAGAIPPLWYEIAVLHFRGSFHSRFMWGPLVYLPLHMAGGLVAGLTDNRATRRAYRALSWGTFGLGLFGTLMHLRGVRRQMGGLYEWRYNVVTGPPIIAPPQVVFFGLIGVLSTSGGEVQRLIHRLRLLEVVAQLLLAIEVGYYHDQNYYANRLQYTPLLLAPALALAQAAAEAPGGRLQQAGRRLERWLSLAAMLVGAVGFGFHVKNVRGRPGGFGWQNLFYGAPLVAPLQLTGQGFLGLLAAAFGADN